MKCPIDEETLVISERQGIEIDYCPQCRGVWLDRGELDKLIERESDRYDTSPPPQSRERERGDRDRDSDRERDRDRDDDDDDRYRSQGSHGGRRKRKGFLSEMFEMGGD